MFGTAQAQCTVAGNVIPCPGFLVGQLNGGTLGSFVTGAEWTTIGKAPFAVPGTGDFPYGQRYQRNATQLLVQTEARTSGANPIIDGTIGIGVVKTADADPALPRLDFDYVYQNQFVTPPTVQKVKVMTITGNTTKITNVSGSTLFCLAPIGSNPPCFGRVGIERTNPSYTLDVNGLIRAQTTIYSSDARFKENVQPIENGLDVINRLNGTTYTFRQDMEGEGYSFVNGTFGGFMAQEVEKVLPQIVYTDEQGYKGLDYVGVIPYLVEGVKELSSQNKSLEARNANLDAKIADLQAQIDALRAGDASGKGAASSLEATAMPAELFQNVPNPTSGATEIRYSLPETVRAAQLLVFDMNGKQLRSFDIRDRGLGNVAIAAGELSSGMYLYTLLADGKEVGTRRMIITE